MKLIKNGRVVRAGHEPEIMDILIERDRIVRMQRNIQADSAEVTDATGLYVFPGLIDMHCHLREPGQEYKEDIYSGTRAAAHGGYTAVACMPNTHPVVDSGALVEYILKRAEQARYTRVYPIGAITQGLEGNVLAEMGDMKAAGAVGVSDDGKPVQSAQVMRLALQYARHFGLCVISHCEDMQLVGKGLMNEGFMSARLGLAGITRAAEEVMVAREIVLSKTLECPVHIAHVSTRGSVDMIRDAKARGVRITAETAPHYFSLTDDCVEGYHGNAKVNPPLREQQDVDAVIEGLRDGTLDAIATDHAPHHADEKRLEFALCANGISGFETALSLALNLYHTGKLSLGRIAELMSTNPARILSVPGGMLREGSAADIALVDIGLRWTVTEAELWSKGKNMPLLGKTLKGRATHTLMDGEWVMQNGQIPLREV